MGCRKRREATPDLKVHLEFSQEFRAEGGSQMKPPLKCRNVVLSKVGSLHHAKA